MAQPTIHPNSDIARNESNYSFSGVIKFFDIIPPIDAVCIDNDDTKKSFDKLHIIPYSGKDKESSHKKVFVLKSMPDLSSTYAGYLSLAKYYALKGKLEISKVEDTIFDIDDEVVVSSNEQRFFSDFIKENFVFNDTNLKELVSMMFDSDDTTGQIGVQVIKKIILGKDIITFKYEEPTDYVFLDKEPIGSEVAISLRWDFEYLKKNPPTLVPLYPVWQKYKNGEERTFFFRKRGSQLYGRPNDISVLPDKYNEHKLKQYLTKKNKKLWLPDVFIETNDPVGSGFVNDAEARAKGYINAENRIDRKFTNAGDNGSSFIVTNRGKDSQQTFIHEFQGLKNSKEVMNYREMFKTAILEANNFPRMLFEMQGTTGFSTNVFLDIFAIYDATKNKEIQTYMADVTNDLLGIGFEKLGASTNELGIKFNSPFKDQLSEYLNSKRGNTEQSGSEGINIQT